MTTPTPPAPDWAAAAAQELARFDGTLHGGKMRATVLALVTARLAGQPEESIWDRATHPDVCSRAVYQRKWKKLPLFASVLTNVEAAARTHQDTRTLRALQSAAESLALASEAAAQQLIGMASRGLVKRIVTDKDGKENVFFEKAAGADILKAVLGLLDRAGIETAAKTSTNLSGEVKTKALTDDERALLLAAYFDAARERKAQAQG